MRFIFIINSAFHLRGNGILIIWNVIRVKPSPSILMAHGHEYNELVRPAASMSSEHNAEWEADDASA